MSIPATRTQAAPRPGPTLARASAAPWRRACVLILLILLVSGGCASTEKSDASTHASLDGVRHPAERLQRRAAIERQHPSSGRSVPAPAQAIPLPPGVSALLLGERPNDDHAAHLTLAEAFDRAIAAAPDWPPGDPPPPLDAPLSAQQRDQALKLYARGRDAALANRHYEVATVLQDALRIDPHSVAIMQVLARSYEALGGSDRALDLWQKILHVQPDHDEALQQVGRAMIDQQKYDIVLSTFGRAHQAQVNFEHDPAAESLAWFTVAHALGELGHDRAFIDASMRSLQAIPEATDLYRRQLASLMQQIGWTYRRIGDAWCRLGDYQHALQAYQHAADHPLPDPGALYPRVLYVHLMLDQPFSAQYELLSAAATGRGQMSARLVLLARYLREHSRSIDDLMAGVENLRHALDANDDPLRAVDLLRLHAQLQPRVQGVDMLYAALLDRRGLFAMTPQAQQGWIDVATDLIVLAAEISTSRAAQITLELMQHLPDESDRLTRVLAAAVRDLPAALQFVQAQPTTPLQRVLAAQLMLAMEAHGRAWHLLAELPAAQRQHPQVRALMMQLAAAVDEPQMFEQIINDAPDEVRRTATELRAQSQALRRTARPELAMQVIRQPLSGEPTNRQRADVLIEEAQVHLDQARRSSTAQQQRQLHVQDAALLLERALEVAPEYLEPLQLLAELHSAGGPLRHPDRYRDMARLVFERGPHSTTYLRLAARENLERQRVHEALEMALVLFALDPSDMGAIDLTLACMSQLGQLDHARQWLTLQLNARPSHPGLLEQSIQVIAATESMHEAQRWLEQQAQQQPDNLAITRLLEQVARQNGHHTLAATLATERLLTRPDGVRRDLELAALDAGQGMIENAIEHIDRMLARRGQTTQQQMINAVGVLNSARTQWSERLSEPVRAALDHALRRTALAAVERHPDAPLQIYGIALRALAEHGPPGQAFDDLVQRAIQSAPGGDAITPRETLVWRDLAQALINEGLSAAASRVVHRRLRAQPVLDRASTTILARIAIAIDGSIGGGDVRIAELLTDLHAADRAPAWASEEHPTLAYSLYEASNIVALLGDQASAIELLQRSVELDDSNAMALNNLGYILLTIDEPYDRDRARRAEHLLTRAHVLDPDDPNILDSLGWLRYQQGFFQQFVTTDPQAAPDDLIRPGALELISRAAASMSEPSAEVRDHHGDVLWRLGRQEQAEQQWRAAYQLLTDPQRQANLTRNYELIQQRIWGIQVADPAVLYQQVFGSAGPAVRAKLDAVAEGRTPKLAPTFVEQAAEQMAAGP